MHIELTDSWMCRSPLLLIDDSEQNLTLLERMLEWAGFVNVRSYTSAQKALQAVGELGPHLVILDLVMPGMSGFEFLNKIRRTIPSGTYLPVLVFTSDLTPEAKIRALELGASDFLTKPGDPVEIQLRVKNFLRARKMHGDLQNQNEILEGRVRERTELLQIARRETVELLAGAGEYRDDNTGQHAARVGEVSAQIAHALGLAPEFVESMRLVAPLHDVGKIAIPDQILRKPGPLTPDEHSIMRRHVLIGAELLAEKTSPLLQLAADIVRYHHERWDGKGYDAGLAGDAIPIGARIVTVADSFDAMTSDRPYRKARPQAEALQELRELSGSQFDPTIVEALHQALGQRFCPVAADRLAS